MSKYERKDYGNSLVYIGLCFKVTLQQLLIFTEQLLNMVTAKTEPETGFLPHSPFLSIIFSRFDRPNSGNKVSHTSCHIAISKRQKLKHDRKHFMSKLVKLLLLCQQLKMFFTFPLTFTINQTVFPPPLHIL